MLKKVEFEAKSLDEALDFAVEKLKIQKEKIKITKPTAIAVLRTKAFLSSVAVLISLAFSSIARYPTFKLSLITFLIVINLN